jgi:hypothetical protein
MNLKRKHHFVSQFYLKSWYNNVEKIIVWDGDKTFPSLTKSIAYEKDLYKLTPLTSYQISFFEEHLRQMSLDNTSTYNYVIRNILVIHNGFNFLDTIENNCSEEIVDLKKKFSFNFLEDKFAVEEAEFSKVIKRIILKPKSKISLHDYYALIHFFVFQLFKTPRKINRFLDVNQQSPIFKGLDFTQPELRSYTLLFIQCLSERAHTSLISRLYSIKIYNNISDINFITSDDPCFNQKFDENEFYVQLPISPKVMIELVANPYEEEYIKSMTAYFNFHKKEADNVILTKPLVTFHELEQTEVIELNKKIFENKDRFVYAQTTSDIESIS